MPDLPITDDEVNGAARSRMVLAKIEAVMLWPDDPVARGAAFQSAWTQYAVPAGAPPEVIAARRANEEDVKRRFRQGVAAGRVLHHALGEGGKLMAEKQAAATLLDLGSPKTMENTHWPRMRSVAHLWASFYSAGAADPESPFPCATADIALFLARAMRLLADAVSTQGRQSPTAGILRPDDDAWVVPPSVRLPEVSISWYARQ